MIKMKSLLISVIVLSCFSAYAGVDIIPASRRINWDPGIPGDIPNYPVGVNVKNFGAVGNGVTDDTQAFINAIYAASEGTALFIPAGNYKITSPLQFDKGIVLRGEGYQLTKLLFNFYEGSCITIVKYADSNWINMLGGYNKGSNTVTVSNGSIFHVNDFVEVRQDNDPAVYSPGELGSFDNASVGQILKVTNVNGNSLTFNKTLYYTYNPSMNPRIRVKGMVQGAGVEKLYFERVNAGAWGSNIVMKNTAYSWVREVWSEKTLTAHIFFESAYGNVIRENFFHDSHLHGSGGQGYGIRTEARSTDNLIENNIFERLRHSMLVQLGACGNVFGYNYSKDPFLEEGNDWLMSDMVTHGHYDYMNLFEGNTVQDILVDNVWGTNGPTTFFRNRIEKNVSHYLNNTDAFPFIDIKVNNPNHNIIGNELGIDGTYADVPIRLDPSIASTIIVHGNYNYIDGSLQWDPSISDHELPNSYYLNEKPDWFGSLPWPLTGDDLSPNSNLIPAQQRYNTGQYIPNFDDSTPPEVNGAQATDSTLIVISFSEALQQSSAGNISNYSIDNGISISNATLSVDGKQVTLTTSPHSTNQTYTVVINNVMDLAGNLISSSANSAQYQWINPFEGLTKLTIPTASASSVPQLDYSADKTIDGLGTFDGDPLSRWAGEPIPQWLIFDLGSLKVIGATKLSFFNWDNGRIYQFSISVSSDMSIWEEVISNAESASEEWTINSFESKVARYVRIDFLSQNQNLWAGLWEGELWGSNQVVPVAPENLQIIDN